MKKRTGIILSALLAGILCAGAVSPLAAEAQGVTDQTISGGSENKDWTGDIDFNLSVKAEYTVIIPQQVTVDAANGSSFAIASTHANTEPGMAVNVRIGNLDEDGNVTLTRQESTEPVTVKSKVSTQSGQPLENNGIAASFSDLEKVEGGEDAETVSLIVGAPEPTGDDQEIRAGKYSGKLDFVVSYEKAQSVGQ